MLLFIHQSSFTQLNKSQSANPSVCIKAYIILLVNIFLLSNWTGMIGALTSDKADLALQTFVVLGERTKVIEFSAPVLHTSLAAGFEQGRIHGQYQSRTGGQRRKCVFSHFPTRSTRTDQPTDQRTDGRTDGRTKPLIESLVRD